MFVEHFIQRVPKALQISFYQREGSKLFTSQRAVNNVFWLLQSTISNREKLHQDPPGITGQHLSVNLQDPERLDLLPHPVSPSSFPVSSHEPFLLFTLISTSPRQNAEAETQERTLQKLENQCTKWSPVTLKCSCHFPKQAFISPQKPPLAIRLQIQTSNLSAPMGNEWKQNHKGEGIGQNK